MTRTCVGNLNQGYNNFKGGAKPDKGLSGCDNRDSPLTAGSIALGLANQERRGPGVRAWTFLLDRSHAFKLEDRAQLQTSQAQSSHFWMYLTMNGQHTLRDPLPLACFGF